MKVVFLHTRLSGYLAACLSALNERCYAGLLIYAWPNQNSAPFDISLFSGLGEVRDREKESNEEIESGIRNFKPDAVLVSGWIDKGYVRICRALKKSGIPIIAGCDTQWTGHWRQRFGAAIAPWHLHQFIDVLWVTGERQRTLAKALGYTGDHCWDGYYACDWPAFAGQKAESGNAETLKSESDNRQPTTDNRQPSFLYVGRYAPEKGLDTLAEAFRRYREAVENPWGLVCAGAGPLRETLVSAGAEDRGFVQPNDLPALMHQASAFILPSRFEPWGVVAQEAAASGLPLILSDACGAGAHLLRHLYNGYSFPAGSVEALTHSMIAMHNLPKDRRNAFAQASFELSKQYTPERWAETLVEGIQKLKR